MFKDFAFSARRLRNGGRFTAAVLCVLVLSACGSRAVKQPEITLESVQVGGLGLRGGTLLVDVVVHNPNRFALNANQLKYALAINQAGPTAEDGWIDFASGVYDQSLTVGARQTERVRIPVEFSYSGLGGAASTVLRSGTFTYRATGEVDVRTPLGTYVVPFQRRGTVTMAGTVN
jgi:LEA14-like dessication related protein